MGNFAYLVKTTLGSDVLGIHELLKVNIAQDEYLTKHAYDLNVGDRVVYCNESIETTLEEVIPVLERSERYRYSREVLHEQNKDGRYVPRFRIELVKGLCDRLGISPLEDLVLQQYNADFDLETKKRMVTEVKTLLERESLSLTDQTIRAWIDGEVISPKDWHVYHALNPLSTSFGLWHTLQGNMGSFHFNYKLYTTIHKNIMSYLARKGAKLSNDLEDDDHIPISPTSYKISLAKEIGLVVSEFMERIDNDTSHAQIISIDKIHTRSRVTEKSSPNLKRRIIRKGPSQQREISLEEVLNRGSFINECISRAIPAYTSLSSVASGLFDSAIHELFGKQISSELKMFLKNVYLIKTLSGRICDAFFSTKIDGLKPISQLESIVNVVVNDIRTGVFDTTLGFEQGTALRMINAVERYSLLQPKLLGQLAILYGNLDYASQGINKMSLDEKAYFNLQKYTALVEEIKRLEEKAKKQYGFFAPTKGLIEPHILEFIMEQFSYGIDESIMQKSYEEIISSNAFFIRFGVREYLSHGEAFQMLKLHGLETAITILAQEFKLQSFHDAHFNVPQNKICGL